MSKKITAFFIGALVTGSLIGLGFNPTVGFAAEKSHQTPMMQTNQMGNIDAKSMADMVKNPEMQGQFIDMMRSPEMQKAMIDVMRSPQMQGIMRQMLQQDMNFHQVMSDLVNSVDMNSAHNMPNSKASQDNSKKSGHSAHHG